MHYIFIQFCCCRIYYVGSMMRSDAVIAKSCCLGSVLQYLLEGVCMGMEEDHHHPCSVVVLPPIRSQHAPVNLELQC